MKSVDPLGDQAVLIGFANERVALQFASAVRRQPPAWLVDVVQAYTTVAVFFDLDQVGYAEAAEQLRQQSAEPFGPEEIEGRLQVIPCCYERGPDLDRVAAHLGRSVEEVIQLHTSTEYTVYAIGFCPGFPYLGYLPAELAGVPRLETPRTRVDAGSVGLTGRQTGIYTEARPAGWNIVGQTPLELVHVADGYFPLRVGDRVRFVRIDDPEYQRLLGRRL
jgi:inhibitor of KinA